MYNDEMLRALRAGNTDKEILNWLVNEVVNHTTSAQTALSAGKTELTISKLGQITTSVKNLQTMVRGLNDGFKMDRKENK